MMVVCVFSLSCPPPPPSSLSLSADLDPNRWMMCHSVVVSQSVSFPLLILIHFRVRASGPMPAKQVILRGPMVGGSALVMLMHNGFCHALLSLTLPCARNADPLPAHAQTRRRNVCTRRMRRTCCSLDGCQQALGAVLDLFTLLRHAVAHGPPQVDPREGVSPGQRVVLDRALVRGPLIPQACGGIRHSRSSFACGRDHC